jgi:hypothetical protein
MTRATRPAEYTGATTLCLNLAFELGSNEWKLGFTTEPGAKPRVRTMPARDLERLTREIADARQWFGLKAATPVRSCYEGGRDGFWLHRYLTARGIENVVVDSSSIEVNRRLRRAKSDGLDARKLLGMLRRYHAGERAVWSVVRGPTVEAEDRRQLHGELRTLKQERTRVANRMNGRLANQGLWLPPGTDVGAAAKTVRLWDGSPVPAALRARLEREWEHAQFLRPRILELERERQRVIAHGRGGHRQSPAAAPPARGRAHRRVGLCERVLRVATVPEPQGGRGGGGAHADAVPEWRREPGTRDQQGGESAHPGGRHRDGLVLVAVSAPEPPELLVSGAIRPRWSPSPEGGDRGPRPEVIDRAVALLRIRRGAGGRQAEEGLTEFPVGYGGRTE